MSVATGLTASVELIVGEPDLAETMKSGSVRVLATPRLIALCEQATMEALVGHLEAAETSVGIRVQLDHLAPVAPGARVTAEATLDKVQGRRLTFNVSASDDRGLVGAGKVTRVVVETDRFLERLH